MYNFVEIDDADEEEEKKTRTRRLMQYCEAALQAGALVEQVYVNFSEFKALLGACDRIFQLSKTLETPHGLLVTGPPGSSKTTLASYFIKSLPESDLFETGFGAIMFRLRTSPSQGHIVSGLLQALKYPFSQVKRGRVFAMRDVAFEALKQRGTKIVFVDQAHCLSSQIKSRHSDVVESAASDTLREMMDETRVGLVLLADASFRGLANIDEALDDRVTVRMPLRHFTNDAEWQGFLQAFSKAVNCVDVAIIETSPVATATLSATDGNRRSFRRLIVEAVIIAVQDDHKILTMDHLKRAFAAVNGNSSQRSNPYDK